MCSECNSGNGKLTMRAYAEAKARGVEVSAALIPSTRGPIKPAAAKPAKIVKPPRIAKPVATNSDPDQAADEFERMRRIVEDFQALSRAGREYVSGRLTSMASAD